VQNKEKKNADQITPEFVLLTYAHGLFPMGETDSDELYWHFPDRRAIFDIYHTKIAKSVVQLIRKKIYNFDIDKNFDKVIEICSQRSITWINEPIKKIYKEIFKIGNAHSIEVYRENQLVGGLYGVTIGAAFFGESMFNLEPNTSKLAFAYLLEVLKYNKFILLDSQYINHFTEQLGAFEISSFEYIRMLQGAINETRKFEVPSNAFENIISK